MPWKHGCRVWAVNLGGKKMYFLFFVVLNLWRTKKKDLSIKFLCQNINLSLLTMSLSWLCPEWSACRTLWDSRISCLNLCLPKATAPLVTITISRPWFCSMATCTANPFNHDSNTQHVVAVVVSRVFLWKKKKHFLVFLCFSFASCRNYLRSFR